MGRHSADAPSAASGEQPGRNEALSEYETGSPARVVPRAPPASRRRVAVAVGVAMLGIVLLVFGLISLISTPDASTNASSQNTTSPAETAASTTTEPTAPPTSAAPQTPAVLPVTVLNNSPDLAAGLATRVAAALEAGGWPIAELLNYSETQLPVTTAFYTPGNAAEQAAAQALADQFPEISGGAQPRFEGLLGTGLTVVAVGDWLP